MESLLRTLDTNARGLIQRFNAPVLVGGVKGKCKLARFCAGALLPCCAMLIASCSESDYCDQLRLGLTDLRAGVLKTWVAQNVAGKELDTKKILVGGGMWPGAYFLDEPFDWSEVGLGERGQIRLIGPNVRVTRVVFFGDRSGYGYLVPVQCSELKPLNSATCRRDAHGVWSVRSSGSCGRAGFGIGFS